MCTQKASFNSCPNWPLQFCSSCLFLEQSRQMPCKTSSTTLKAWTCTFVSAISRCHVSFLLFAFCQLHFLFKNCFLGYCSSYNFINPFSILDFAPVIMTTD
eukprot:c31255_g1_i1 orf=124-426(+)